MKHGAGCLWKNKPTLSFSECLVRSVLCRIEIGTAWKALRYRLYFVSFLERPDGLRPINTYHEFFIFRALS